MKNLFTYDFINRTIVASKATLKKASNPGTAEYKALMEMIAGQPTFRVAEKVIEINRSKETYSGLTYELMERFIDSQESAEQTKKVYEAVKKYAKTAGRSVYPITKKWFLNKFKDFEMDKALEAIADNLVKTAEGSVSVSEEAAGNKVISIAEELPAAANQ